MQSTVRIHHDHIQSTPRENNTAFSGKFFEKQQNQIKQEHLKSVVISSVALSLVVFASVQLLRGTFINIDRYITLNTKFTDLKTLDSQASYQNAVLKKKFKNYTSTEGLEGLARDHLNLVGKNEISIVLKKS